MAKRQPQLVCEGTGGSEALPSGHPCSGRKSSATSCRPVDGLLFGDPNGLTKDEQDINGGVLRAYAKVNAPLLGFNPDAGPIQAVSFHPMFHISRDGGLFVNMVVELVQTVRTLLGDAGSGTFPMRNGATLLISQDASDGDDRPKPRVRFVIAKLHSKEREERVRIFFAASGLAISTKIDDGMSQEDDARFQINYALLHTGV